MEVRLIVGALAAWRLALMLTREDGPFDVFERIRRVSGVYYTDECGRPLTTFGRLLNCLWCTSMWTGTLTCVVVFTSIWPVLVPFAFSAVAVLIDTGVEQWRDRT